ncbi:MAG: SDR family oxidoreductase [Gracilibacteraceae bacterium]|nr:SDR family oxidoreductase [Gracilibacteraceae bacterium]
MRLKGNVALIPGGTSGIGEQIALAFAREGATVVVASRNRERVDKVTQAIKSIGQGGGIVADITSPDQAEGMVTQVVAEYGKIDILLNSAGFYPVTPFTQITPEEWHSVIDVNLSGPLYCAVAAAKEMVKRNYGRVIFITSGQGLRGVPLMAHYSAAKGGLIALARAMAAELGPHGVTVNTIAAGLTTTDMVNTTMPPQFLEMIAQNIPVKRLAVPDEYNETAILLASKEAGYITAVTIAVDGGTSNADAVH